MNNQKTLRTTRDIAYFAVCLCLIALLYSIVMGVVSFILPEEKFLANASVHFNLEDVKNNALVLTVTPGIKTNITIELAKSIQGLWMSRDLAFIINDPVSTTELVQIDLKKDQDWGEEIGTNNIYATNPATVFFELSLPENISIGSQLSGRLIGNVIYPSPVGMTNTEEGLFSNNLEEFDLPITLQVVNREEFIRIRRIKMGGPMIKSSCITILLMTILVPTAVIQNRKLKNHRLQADSGLRR
jgi:hypothetical protein